MEFSHILVILSGLLTIGGSVAYIRDTVKGHTKPNRISWFVWAVFPLIGTAAAIQAHADLWAVVRIFLAGVLPLIVFAGSFLNRQSYWHLGIFDWVCGAAAVLSLAVWAISQDPVLAILSAVVGDTIATLPTIYKAWKYPATETGITYIVNLVALLLVIPSIPVWDVINSAFQIYLFVANVALIIAIYRKRWRWKRHA